MSGHWDPGEDRLTPRERRRVEWQGALLAGLLRAWGSTWRIEDDAEGLARARALSPNGAVIYLLWHNRMLMLSYTHRFQGAQVLRSGSRDGQLIAAANRRLGFVMPAGSGSRGGAAGLRTLVKAARGGADTALTVDGPRGPRGFLHAGALQLAALSGCPLLPITAAASRMKRFDTWDRTLLPWPFARLKLRYGEPRLLPRAVAGGEQEGLRRELQQQLQALSDGLDREFGAEPIPPAGPA